MHGYLPAVGTVTVSPIFPSLALDDLYTILNENPRSKSTYPKIGFRVCTRSATKLDTDLRLFVS